MLTPLVMSLACNPDGDGLFGGGGSATGDLSEDVGEDSGADADDGWPDPVDANGPSLMNEDCYVEEFPGYGWVLTCEGDVKDDQDDVVGGELRLVLSGGAYGEKYAGEFPIDSADANDACDACYQKDEDFFYFSVQDADDDEDFEIWFQLVDEQGNRGNEVEVTVVGQ